MRISAAWKLTVFIIMAGWISPLWGQNGPPPTQEQLAALDQYAGVGSLKFGAKLEDFPSDDLKPMKSAEKNNAYFQYLKTDDVTWGTLRPSEVDLQFFEGRLTGVMLQLEAERGILITIHKALMEKYGASQYTGSTDFAGMAWGNSGTDWKGKQIEMIAALPGLEVPTGANEQFLTEKVKAAVIIYAAGLWRQLADAKTEALKQKINNPADLDKIKANL